MIIFISTLALSVCYFLKVGKSCVVLLPVIERSGHTDQKAACGRTWEKGGKKKLRGSVAKPPAVEQAGGSQHWLCCALQPTHHNHLCSSRL